MLKRARIAAITVHGTVSLSPIASSASMVFAGIPPPGRPTSLAASPTVPPEARAYPCRRTDPRLVRGAPDGERSGSLDRLLPRRPGATAGPPHSGPPGRVLLGAVVRQGNVGIVVHRYLAAASAAAHRVRCHAGARVRSVAALRRAGITARSGDGTPIEEPIVLTWMPAASVYFDDPDGHSLEFISMLDEAPRPDLGWVSWSEWRRRA